MKRICRWSSMLLSLVVLSAATAAADGEIIASYFDCWQPEPPPGWQVLTNARGPIGDAVHYEPLVYVNEADGTISREMMPDLLHVASKGLDILAEALIPVLEKMYGSP